MPPRRRGREAAESMAEEEEREGGKVVKDGDGDNYRNLQKSMMENMSLTKSLAASVVELKEENRLLKEEVARLKREAKEITKEVANNSNKLKNMDKDALEAFEGVGKRLHDLENQVEEIFEREEEEVLEVVEVKMAEKEKEEKRKRQIRITGIAEQENETPVMLKKEVVALFEQKMKVEDGAAMIVDVFRVGKKGGDKMGRPVGRPRNIVARLASEWQRNMVLIGKLNLREWKEIGVDFDRSPEQIEEVQSVLKRKWEKKKGLT